MEQQVKDKLCKQIDTEIDKISAMPSLTDVALGNLYKLIEIKKGILKIDMLESELEPMNMGYSNRNQYSNRSYSNMGNSYDGRMGGNSNHYVDTPIYGGGYSMDGNDAYSHLEQAMRVARSDREREAIRQAMSKM